MKLRYSFLLNAPFNMGIDLIWATSRYLRLLAVEPISNKAFGRKLYRKNQPIYPGVAPEIANKINGFQRLCL